MAKGLKETKVYKLASETSKIVEKLIVPQDILREHNKPTYDKIKEAFEYVQSVAVSQATGTGKSFLSIQWLADNLKEGQKAIYLAPNDNIANQFKKHIKELGLAEKLKNLKFVLYPSLQNEVDAMLESSTEVDYIVADEFHRLGATTWNPSYLELIDNNPEALVLGLSATPVRYLDGERDMAEELFEETVEGINLVDAIKQGIIPTPEYVQGIISYSASLEQLEKRLKYVKDEHSRNEIVKEIRKLKRNIEQAGGLEELFGEYIEKKDGKYVLFCSDLNHLLEIKDKIEYGLFSQVNPSVKIYDVSYQKTDKQVEREIDKFENDEGEELKIMLSVEMLNEGVHIKGLDGAIMMRKTISPRIYLQQLGRVLAVGGKEKPLVIDVVENYESLEFLGSYFTDNKYKGSGRGEESVLPFKVKGKSVDIDKFIKNIEDLMYKSMGDQGWLKLAESYYSEHGDLKVPVYERNLYRWLARKRRLYLNDPMDSKNNLIFDELTKMDPYWFKARSPGNEEFQMDKLMECRKFYLQQGHLNVNASLKGERNGLYVWLASRRKEYKKNPQLPSRKWIYNELSSMDPDWHKDTYEKKLIECREYYAKHGDLIVPRNLENGRRNPLYKWLVMKKKEYRDKVVDTKKQRIFEELSKIDPNWHKYERRKETVSEEEQLQKCREYYKVHGNLFVPTKLKDGSFNDLYAWLLKLKKVYRSTNDKNQWIFEELSKIDSNWHKDRGSGNLGFEEEQLQKCKKYFETHGDLAIPTKLEDGSVNNLYAWICNRRKEYRKNPKDEKNSWIFEALVQLDPEWHKDRHNGNINSQKAKLQECKRYCEIHGDLLVPQLSQDGKYSNLFQWLYKLKLAYHKNPEEKKWLFEELSRIDSDWYKDTRSRKVRNEEEQLQKCREYFNAHGNLFVPTKLKDGSFNNLYRWIGYKRKEYRKNPAEEKNRFVFDELKKITPYWYLTLNEYKTILEEENEKE